MVHRDYITARGQFLIMNFVFMAYIAINYWHDLRGRPATEKGQYENWAFALSYALIAMIVLSAIYTILILALK